MIFFKKIIKIPNVVFPYLIGIFPLLFIFNYNKEELYIYELLLPVIISLLSIKVLMILFIKLLQDAKKSGLFLLVLIITFFFYDNIYDFLIPYRDWPVLTNLNQFLIPVFIIILLLSLIFIKNLEISTNIVKFLNIIGVSLIILNLLEISIYKIFKDTYIDC